MRRFAWIPGVLGSLLVLVFLLYRYILGSPPTWVAGLGAGGAVLLLVYLWLDRDSASALGESRAIRYASGAGLLVLFWLGIVVASTVLAMRFDHRWDISSTQRNSLSPQSVEIAKGLDNPVTAVGFFQIGTVEEGRFEDLVEAFQVHTDRITLQLVDPVRNPQAYRQFERFMDPEAMGSDRAVLIEGDRYEVLAGEMGESQVTNALARLVSGVEHPICFTVGHGERQVDDDSSLAGYAGLVARMQSQNYRVQTILPLRDGEVPAECEVVVVAAPQLEVMPEERDMLDAHVRGGGGLVVLLEPIDPRGLDPLAESMARYGIEVGNDLVLEIDPRRDMAGFDSSYLVLDSSSFDFHPIAEDLHSMILMQGVRSVSVGDPVEGVQVQVLARTTDQGWAETDLQGIMEGRPVGPDEGLETVGGVGVVALATLDSEGKVAVFGDADFASNALVLQGLNHDLFLNTIAWMVGEADQVSVRRNENADGSLEVTTAQLRLTWVVSLLLVPGLALLAALGTWFRRRRL